MSFTFKKDRRYFINLRKNCARKVLFIKCCFYLEDISLFNGWEKDFNIYNLNYQYYPLKVIIMENV